MRHLPTAAALVSLSDLNEPNDLCKLNQGKAIDKHGQFTTKGIHLQLSTLSTDNGESCRLFAHTPFLHGPLVL